ncbi:MAG: hypothetical protein ACREJG_09780 [Candidatus Rokuibacteriota bacterium]
MIKSFLLGAIAGAAAMYLYGQDIKQYVDESTRDVRSRAAGTLLNVAETIEGGIQQVDERIDEAKDAVRSARGSAA